MRSLLPGAIKYIDIIYNKQNSVIHNVDFKIKLKKDDSSWIGTVYLIHKPEPTAKDNAI